MSGPGDGDLPTWEQLLTGAGHGVGVCVGPPARARRFGTATARHARAWAADGAWAWPDDGAPCLPHDWEARWAEIVRDLRGRTAADERCSRTAMSWREAWEWTAAATVCAAAASALLR